MTFLKWLLDKKVYFILHAALTMMTLVFMSVFGMNTSSIVFVSLMIVLTHVSYLLYEYFRRYKYYKKIDESLMSLDKKHYIHEFMEEPYFFEGLFLQDIIQASNKSMNDEISIYKSREKDYRDYIETWVHEIKTPIAAAHLVCKNNPSTVTNSFKEELDRIEEYVEQALYYARGQQLEKDYIIKEVSLMDLVQNALKKHAKKLINAKCQIQMFEQDIHVNTDEKWLLFILGQLINNSIQYRQDPMKLSFDVIQSEHQIQLVIEDNGLGISESELPRVFEKGFTGLKGRKLKKSTGIGLYLCHSLSQKMGMHIGIQSKENEFTKVILTFPYLKV